MSVLIPVGLLLASVLGVSLLIAVWRREVAVGVPAPVGVGGRQLVADALTYALGANLAFLAQEIALVVSKAPLPGVSATLFHNSHDWIGDHPRLDLIQGAGLAGLLVAAVLGLVVARRSGPGGFVRGAAWWTCFHGSVAFLVNLASGVVSPDTEAGEFLAALGLADGSSGVILGVLAVLAVPLVGLQLGPALLGGAESADVRTAVRRVVQPAMVAVPVLALFRFPSAEGAMGGLILLVAAAPWAALGAAGPERASVVIGDAAPGADPGWRAPVLATVASLVVAVGLSLGLTVG